MGLELREVDLNELVVLGTLVLAELLCVFAGEVTNVLTLGSGEVVVHAVVEGEDRGGGTDLGCRELCQYIPYMCRGFCSDYIPPMLQIVAMPVQDRLSVPGPWYSTMAPVPPLTVRIPATLRMMSRAQVSFVLDVLELNRVVG